MKKSNNIIDDIHIRDLPYAFKWQNPPKSFIIEQDKLIVGAGSKKDFYIAPDGSKVKDNVPFLYMETSFEIKCVKR